MSNTVKLLDGSEKTYLSCAETARLVRNALKAEFPDVKFSVRSSTYSGGASIRVRWTDGPTAAEVDAVAGKFAGADFDGMVDLKTYSSHWLHPDGSVSIATAGGQGSTHPEIIGDPLGPKAMRVSFGADFVFTDRDISEEWRQEILDEFERVSGHTIPRGYQDGYWETRLPLSIDRDGSILRMVDHETEYVSDLVHRYTATHAR